MNLLVKQFGISQSATQAAARHQANPRRCGRALNDGKRGSPCCVGLIPSWAKDAKIAYSTINARARHRGRKPGVPRRVQNGCLVLADGYYGGSGQCQVAGCTS
jgi:putative SOS response-associated peptidase YedK